MNAKCALPVLLLTVVLSTVCAGEDTLVLVAGGTSHAPIVVFRDAPPRTRNAADQLAEYMEKTSGVRPKVIDGSPDPTICRRMSTSPC